MGGIGIRMKHCEMCGKLVFRLFPVAERKKDVYLDGFHHEVCYFDKQVCEKCKSIVEKTNEDDEKKDELEHERKEMISRKKSEASEIYIAAQTFHEYGKIELSKKKYQQLLDEYPECFPIKNSIGNDISIEYVKTMLSILSSEDDESSKKGMPDQTAILSEQIVALTAENNKLQNEISRLGKENYRLTKEIERYVKEIERLQ